MQAIDFYSKTPPTQAQFDEYHKEPIDYGEDGEQLVDIAYDDMEVDLAKVNIRVKRINNSVSRAVWNKTKQA